MIDWMLLASIGSMLAFWATALFILYQIRHMQAARNLEVTMRIFEWSESSRMCDAMRWVTTQFDVERYLAQPEPERSEYPELIVAFFEQAGIMIQKRLIDEDVVIDHLAASVLKAWPRLAPWIAWQRRQSGDERIGEHFELLHDRALAYEARYRKQRGSHPV